MSYRGVCLLSNILAGREHAHMRNQSMNKDQLLSLLQLGSDTIQELETDRGILASSNEELFGFVFGRDSCIAALKLLAADVRRGTRTFFPHVRKILIGLAQLQGISVNIESGEEPGKIIHDYREKNHELLTVRLEHPWYVYPDGIMRSFDSVDATPLFLMTAARYIAASGDTALFQEIRVNIISALRWILEYADLNSDELIDYRMHPDRKSGGLYVQNWMDHETSLFHEDGSAPVMPVAPLEVQAYAYAALRMWGDMFNEDNPDFSRALHERALRLKTIFNRAFPVQSPQGFFLASGIDGSGKQIQAVRSTMGHVLWAVWRKTDGSVESILDVELIPRVAGRLMRPDLFEPHAGIRTLSTYSIGFTPDGYHNGALWPHDTSIVAEGLENFGYDADARRIRDALFEAFRYFKAPIELFVYDGGQYKDFHSSFRDPACKKQAWSAAAMVENATALLDGR